MKLAIFKTAELKKVISSLLLLNCHSSVLPILECMKVVCFPEDQGASIRATNLIVEMKHQLDCECTEHFMFLIPFKQAYNVLINIDTEDVEFQVTDNSVCIISDETIIKFAIEANKIEEYPKIVTPDENGKGYIMASDSFNFHLMHAAKFVSHDELRPSITFINLTSYSQHLNSDNTLYFVATDGNMLLFKKSHVNYCGYDMLIHPTLAPICQKVFAIAEPLVIFKKDNRIIIAGHRCRISVRDWDEKYPAWQDVMPKDDAFSFYLKRKSFTPLLRLASLFAHEITHQVKLSIGKSKMKIHAEDVELGQEYSSAIMVLNSDQEMDLFEIGFDVRFLTKSISTSKDELIKVSHSQDPHRAAVINGEVLIMPMKFSYEL